jgi:hypothetical protein
MKKPIQRTSFAEKVANNFKLCRDTIDYYISNSDLRFGNIQSKSEVIDYYNVYNNKLPEKWFGFVTNPLSTENEAHKNFPARIRKMNILRTNIDLLLGEFLRRPFAYAVENKSEDAYNSYVEQRMQVIQQSIHSAFVNSLVEQGVELEGAPEDVPLPEKAIEEFDGNYLDAVAVKAQKYLNIVKEDEGIYEKLVDMFKDYLIAGDTVSYKEIYNDKLNYHRVSPVNFDCDKSPHVKYYRKGEWAVHRQLWTASDVADRFYEELKEKDYKSMETSYNFQSLYTFAESLNDIAKTNYVEVIHCAYRSMKKVGILTYIDPITGETQKDEVEEGFVLPEEIKEEFEAKLKWVWRNQVWSGFRVNGDLYLDIKPLPFEDLPYNGRRFSDTHSENISILAIGVPYLVLYIILNYRLELTIAKSKGKIVLIDQNVIPRTKGWDEEKFIYYGEALGWGLINREQIGVDKGYNQYQVVDLSLYEYLKQLVESIEYVKQQWDDAIGINPQRKGQVAPSAGKGVTERATFQSSIISDIIFFTFESFIKNEYQDFLDYAKYTNLKGMRRLFLRDDFTNEMLNLEPEDFVHADLGIFVTNSSIEQERLDRLKMYAEQSLANGGKLSTVAKVVSAESMSKMRRVLETVERKEMEYAQGAAESEQAAVERLKEIEKEFDQFKAMLDVEKMHQEYDRKEAIEHIKGQYNQLSFTGTLDADNNGIPDAIEVQKNSTEIMKSKDKVQIEREKIRSNERTKEKEIKMKDKELAFKEKELKVKERIERFKGEIALKNPVAGERKKPKK